MNEKEKLIKCILGSYLPKNKYAVQILIKILMEASKRIILFKKPPKEILVSVILQKNGGCTHVYIFTAANVCICKWYSSF